MIARSLGNILGLMVVTGLLAAGGCSTAVTGFGAVGTFTLVDVDGLGLPATLSDQTQVLSGSLSLNTEGRCTARTVVMRPGMTSTEEIQAECTWSQSGGGLGIVWTADGSLSLGTVLEDDVSFQISPTTPGCPPIPGAACAPSDWSYAR